MDDGLVERVIAGKEVLVDERNNRMYVCNPGSRGRFVEPVPAKLDICVCCDSLYLLRLLRLLRYFQVRWTLDKKTM
jgi:hypothetical protein